MPIQVQIPAGSKLVDAIEPKHPVWPALGPQQIAAYLHKQGGGAPAVRAYNQMIEERNERIRLERDDPLNFGYEPAVWKLTDLLWGWIGLEEFLDNPDVPAVWKTEDFLQRMCEARCRMVLILGGNRAAKTEYMCKRIVQCLVRYAGTVIYLFHENISASIKLHQGRVWKYLPQAWKDKNGKTGDRKAPTYISYKPQTGFSTGGGSGAGSLMGPQMQRLDFLTYEAGEKGIQGDELGEPQRRPCLGYGADEDAPVSLLENLGYRLATREAVGVQGFTPIDEHGNPNYSDNVARILDGAKTLLRRKTIEVLDRTKQPRRIPFVQENRVQLGEVTRVGRSIYFSTKDNPYGNWQAVAEECVGKGDAVVLCRLYGVPHKQRMGAFPKFSDEMHVLPQDKLPTEGLTVWCIIDPGGAKTDKGGKNWFMSWIGVDVYDRWYILDEWPSPRRVIPGWGYPEPWAVPGKAKGHEFGGVPGGGQRAVGLDLPAYKSIIADIEGWEDAGRDIPVEQWHPRNGVRRETFAYRMDSRFSGAAHYTREGNTSLLEEFAALGIHCEPTAGRNIAEGVQLINHRLSWKVDKWERPEDGPQLFIGEHCENTIWALKNYTGAGGDREACKDPIDNLRYAAFEPLYHVSGQSGYRAPGSMGYGSGGSSRKSDPLHRLKAYK